MPWIVGWRGTLDLFAFRLLLGADLLACLFPGGRLERRRRSRAKLLEFFYGDVFTSNFENLGP